jgi:hypothetical protein
MLCDVALFGEVKVPDLCIDDFLCAQVPEALLPGLPPDAITALPRSVEAALEELRAWPTPAPEYLSVAFDGGRLQVRGLVSEGTFLELAPGLAGLCGAAAAHGGGGTVLMVGLGAVSFGYSARCAFGRSSVRNLTVDAVEAVRGSPALERLRDAARSSLEALLGEGAGAPFTGAV